MVSAIAATIAWVLGLGATQLTLWQMGVRAVIVYLAALVMVRLVGDRRFIGKHAALDVLLTIILGATLSRAINGSAPFFGTLVAGLVLVGMHGLLAAIAFHFPVVESWIKGDSRVLIWEGQIHPQAMQKSHISRKDLESSLRLQAKLADLDQVRVARLESGGEISVIPQEQSPKILEVAVDSGVQTVRIALD